MKKIIFTIGVLMSCAVYSQVGINTEIPKATLDVAGKPSDITAVDGIIAPKLKGSELKAKDALYTDEQKASLVYVTEPLDASETTAKTVNVTSIGYFYFDGSIWQTLNATNGANPANGGMDYWSLLGNNGSSPGTNFIGTTDAQDFVVKTNNIERERTYKAATVNNTIKKIDGGDLLVNGITLGRGKGNNVNNTVVSYQGLDSNTTGANNVAVGSYSLNKNTEGNSNIALGHSSLSGNLTGSSNIALGQSAMPFNTTGGNNIAIGHSALSNTLNKTGTDNIAIGFTAGGKLEDGTSNNIVIGSKQNLASKTGSNQLNIGGVIFGTGLTGTEVAPAGNIGIGTTTPSTKLEINNGTTNGAIKIVDGTQGAGRVLTSDANGVGTWKESSLKMVVGGFPDADGAGNMPFSLTTAWKNTKGFITLPPGRYRIELTMLLKGLNPSLDLPASDYCFYRFSLTESTNSAPTALTGDFFKIGLNGSITYGGTQFVSTHFYGPKAKNVAGGRNDKYAIATGSFFVDNRTSSSKTYYVIVGNSKATTDYDVTQFWFEKVGGSGWSENSIVASPVLQ